MRGRSHNLEIYTCEVSNKNENSMAYTNFTLRQVEKDFHLQIEEKIDLFAHVTSIALVTTLKRSSPKIFPLPLRLTPKKGDRNF